MWTSATFFVQLVAAGNDTTKTLTSSGLLALLQHPDQLGELRADPSLIPGAVEEMLRWCNPIHYMRRTATADTELSGVPIAAGQKLAMYYTSANRDEAVFADSQSFDIRRSPNRHVSFGFAEHFCLGAHLARLEGRVFLRRAAVLVRRHRIEWRARPAPVELQQRLPRLTDSARQLMGPVRQPVMVQAVVRLGRQPVSTHVSRPVV